jgi:putative ABC transport system permease protein
VKVLQSLRMSWRAIRGHRLRSALTVVGIVIGVAAVITFVTLGASLQAAIIGDISPDDENNVYVWAAPEDQQGGGPGAGAQAVFTRRDAAVIANQSAVEEAYVTSPLFAQAIRFDGETRPLQGSVVAAGEGYIDPGELREGEVYEDGKLQAVLNPAATSQFQTNVTVGDRITLVLPRGLTVDAEVVGVLDTDQPQGPFEGFGEQARIYVPVDPYYTSTAAGVGGDENETRYAGLIVEPRGNRIDDAKEQARAYLESDASDASDRDDGLAYSLKTSEELLAQLRNVLDTLTGFITGIALISLLVGAIGIANIMLVSVTERTREIGIMKAVGAQNRDVLQLFLTESIVLGILGAVFGVVVGLLGGYVATEWLDLPYQVPLEWAGVAVVVGVLVGIFAGLYPAWNAAKTDPIDALRYE